MRTLAVALSVFVSAVVAAGSRVSPAQDALAARQAFQDFSQVWNERAVARLAG